MSEFVTPEGAAEMRIPQEVAARLDTVGLDKETIKDAEILDICSDDSPTFGTTGETFGAARLETCDPYVMDEDELVYVYAGELPYRSEQFTHVIVTSGPLVEQLGNPNMVDLSADIIRVLKMNGQGRIRNGFGNDDSENGWTPEEILEATLQNTTEDATVRVERVTIQPQRENDPPQHYVILRKLPVTNAHT